MPLRLAVYFLETGDERVKPALLALAAFFEGQAEVRGKPHLICCAQDQPGHGNLGSCVLACR